MHHMLFPPFLPVPTILDRHPINLINLPKHKPIAFAEQSTAHLFVRQYSMRQSGGAYPVVSLTDLGREVMHDRTRVELDLEGVEADFSEDAFVAQEASSLEIHVTSDTRASRVLRLGEG